MSTDRVDVVASPLETASDELQSVHRQTQDRPVCGTHGGPKAEDNSPTDKTASTSTAVTDGYIEIQLSDLVERALQLRHNLDIETAARKTLEKKLKTMKAQVAEAAKRMQEELSKTKDLENKHTTHTLELQMRMQELVASNAVKDEMVKSQASKIESMEARSEMEQYISDLKMHIEETAARDAEMQTMIRAHAAKIEALEATARKSQLSFGGIKWGYLLEFIFIQTVIEWVCAHWPYYRSIRPTMQWVCLGLFVLLMPPQ